MVGISTLVSSILYLLLPSLYLVWILSFLLIIPFILCFSPYICLSRDVFLSLDLIKVIFWESCLWLMCPNAVCKNFMLPYMLGFLGFHCCKLFRFYQSSILYIHKWTFVSLLDFLWKNKKINTAVNIFPHFLWYSLPHNFTANHVRIFKNLYQSSN